MEQPLICPNCTRAILPDHTLVFEQGPPTHLDCKQPRALSPEERILPFAYCREHPIAECKDRVASPRLPEIDAPPESRSARRRRGSDMDTNAAGGSVERTR